MNSSHCEAILLKHGIRPTAVRILLLEVMERFEHTFSLADLETEADTLDKSSIFRSLALFAEHHLVHALEDGSGMMKYEICEGEGCCSIDDMHTHFYCEVCHRTFCFKTIHIPGIELPEGFKMTSINYMVKGTCPHCSRHAE